LKLQQLIDIKENYVDQAQINFFKSNQKY